MPDAFEQFVAHASMVRDYSENEQGQPGLSELDTRTVLVTPVLHLLGYRDVIDIRQEVPIPATKESLDYELRVDGQPRVIVEAKALRHEITSQHAGQCVQYAAVLGVRWCLITNARTWEMYDAHARGTLVQKQVSRVGLVDDREAEKAWQVLSLFSRESLSRAMPLTRLLVDRVVEDELRRAESPAVHALRRAVKTRFDEQVSSAEVVDSVRRLTGSESHIGLQAVPAAVATAGAAGRRATAIAELIDAGLLPEDATIECTVRGVTHTARLREGQIELAGSRYATPSAAASALLNGTAVNGWNVWRFNGRRLVELRSQLRPATHPDQKADAT